MATVNGWKAIEVISEGEATGEGYAMPGTFDGIGAVEIGDSIALLINHELSTKATISEVRLNKEHLRDWISFYQTNELGAPPTEDFVVSAQPAYERVSDDGGQSWQSGIGTFRRFCSSQSYIKHSFGVNRGFEDTLYITGEEVPGGRLTVLYPETRDLYVLTGHTGGPNGMPADSYENAAALDTGDTEHIALLLSPDGGSREMKLFIGEKGLDSNGDASNSFLARNGLEYGEWFYLIGRLIETVGESSTGSFSTNPDGAFSSTKLEDIDTNPDRPTTVVLGDQDSGVFILDFQLDFSDGAFQSGSSSFTAEMITDNSNRSLLNAADNVDWTAATTLGGVEYPDGIIFVNEDNASGQVWQIRSDGSEASLIGGTIQNVESSGILDISELVGYYPGSVLACTSQSIPTIDTPSSLTILLNPNGEIIEREEDECSLLCVFASFWLELFAFIARIFGL